MGRKAKTSILLILLLAVFISSTAFAEDNGVTLIQFRNIPWGTTVGYFIDNIGGVNTPNSEYNWWKGDTKIPEKGSDCTVRSVYSTAYYLDSPYEVESIDNDKYDNVPGRRLEWHMYRKEEPFKVAGYDINSIELYFMQPVENGTVNHDPESAKFYMAEYEIANNVDRVSVFDDLTGKLTNLYGDVFYEIEDGQVVRTWKDSEGNTVSLMRYGTEWENLDSITIIYMSATAMDDIQNLEKALYDEQYITDSNARQENADNYDGL